MAADRRLSPAPPARARDPGSRAAASRVRRGGPIREVGIMRPSRIQLIIFALVLATVFAQMGKEMWQTWGR